MTRSRLTLDLGVRQTRALNDYCNRHGVTKADALRTAVSLQMQAEAARAAGLIVGAWKPGLEREFIT